MQSNEKHIVMVASENGALIGGKFGGIGDVVKNLPQALIQLGWKITTIIPSYGFLHKQNLSKLLIKLNFPFQGNLINGEIWKVETDNVDANLTTLLFEHPDIRGSPIYFNDPPESPFWRDAKKYAMFCSAVGVYLKTIPQPYILHLHDWHTATLLLLRELHPEFQFLKNIKTIYTIHNLAIQGTRPMRNNESSLENWFPELFLESTWIENWKDPRYQEPCYNPMLVGIHLADKINTVSPTYSKEILKPSNYEEGYFGGEGLELPLQTAFSENRLYGILNGCEYPPSRENYHMPFDVMCDLLKHEVTTLNKSLENHTLGNLISHLEKLKHSEPEFVFTSVSRIVEQKIKLLFEIGSDNRTSIDKIIDLLTEYKGVYFIFGSGTPDYEQMLLQKSKQNERLVYIKGFSEIISKILYANGTAFIMPSLYEPCGISQMLAMRDGQPCIASAVGGLKDTIINNVNGFTFSGKTLREKSDNLIYTIKKVINLLLNNKSEWGKIKINALKARFTWEESAKQYNDLLYTR